MSSTCPGSSTCRELLDAGSHIKELKQQNKELLNINYRLQKMIYQTYSLYASLNDTDQSSTGINSKEAYLKTITALTSAIDAKDTYTRNHSKNVARYAVSLGKSLGLSEKELSSIRYGAVLHDIGKIGIPDVILNKPGQLSEDEYKIIMGHPSIGASILAPIDFLQDSRDIVQHHHERYDGGGYPFGLKGESIPFAARVVGIADSWDAMTSDRSYRHALRREKAVLQLEEGSGSQFDPVMVKTFINSVINSLPL